MGSSVQAVGAAAVRDELLAWEVRRGASVIAPRTGVALPADLRKSDSPEADAVFQPGFFSCATTA
jgi:hypothetical protein